MDKPLALNFIEQSSPFVALCLGGIEFDLFYKVNHVIMGQFYKLKEL